MQNKSALWVFTILLTLACIYQLSFSFVTTGFEKKADSFAQTRLDSAHATLGDGEEFTLTQRDSILTRYRDIYMEENGNNVIYPVFGYTYNECKEKEINLGLDLQGGMSVTLEISLEDLVKNYASTKQSDENFQKSIARAREIRRDQNTDFITAFEKAFNEVNPEGKMAAIFNNRDYKEKFPATASNDEIITILRKEAREAINDSEKIIRNRIDRFGVTQPTIQRQQYTDRILIELPGVKDKDRVRNVLQSTASLEFWETYENEEVADLFNEANKILRAEMGYDDEDAEEDEDAEIDEEETEEATADAEELEEEELEIDEDADLDELLGDEELTDEIDDLDDLEIEEDEFDEEEFKKQFPLFGDLSLIKPAVFRGEDGGIYLAEGPRVGFVHFSDTAQVNQILRRDYIANIFPANLRFHWGAKPGETGLIPLYAVKITTTDGKPRLTGEVIVDARQEFDPLNNVEVTMQMNSEGASIWKNMTKNNIGKSIAIILDNEVYSAPVVQTEIANGRSSISMGRGNRREQMLEAQDLANILKAGSLPAPAHIVDESVIGPSLGQHNIDSGLISFIIALVVILFYMIFYYNGAGIVSDIALIANLFFLIGALASMQASLTLPGIAGIILTIGIAVDSNVLIFERIKEEMRAGKGVKQAISDGYKNAYSAIIDANITTLLTAIVLAVFGSGPIQGFATTLIIGIFTSLFSAIFITRLIFTWMFEKKINITLFNKFTENLFQNFNIKFLEKRKIFYAVSAIIIIIGIASLFTRKLDLGVDFVGGRTYQVEFKEEADIEKIKTLLGDVFVDESGLRMVPEVKTIESANQVKITTKYMIDERGTDIDNSVEAKLDEGLTQYTDHYEIKESRMVDASISDDILTSAMFAVFFSLIIIFLYILFRFRRWQFGLGALFAMTHDVLVVLACYSLFYGILPFSLEIDQAFIAAILTVVGYSINDTVVVFDRIREYLSEYKKQDTKDVVNKALNSTLSRTINTSLSTFIVLLTIFILGSESIRGFVFALMVGVVVGTYSSLFIATPAAYDMAKDIGEVAKKSK